MTVLEAATKWADRLEELARITQQEGDNELSILFQRKANAVKLAIREESK